MLRVLCTAYWIWGRVTNPKFRLWGGVIPHLAQIPTLTVLLGVEKINK